MRRLNAGKLRHSMTVQTRSVTRGDGGEFSLSWSDAYNLRGSISTLIDISLKSRQPDGKEYRFAGATSSDTDFLIQTRSIGTKPTPKDRLVFGTRVFNIVSCVDSEEIKHCRFIYVKEQNEDVAENSAVSAKEYSFPFGEISFLATNNVSYAIPSGKTFFPKRVEVVCSGLDGVISTFLQLNVGIPSDHTNYLSAEEFSQPDAVNDPQDKTLLQNNNGVTDSLWIEITTAATLSSGTLYRGSIIVWGDLVG